VIGESLLVQCCPWVGEVRQLLSHWDQGRRNPALALDKPEGYRKITPIAAPIVGKPEQVSDSLTSYFLRDFQLTVKMCQVYYDLGCFHRKL
jgi:hypothetical protein